MEPTKTIYVFKQCGCQIDRSKSRKANALTAKERAHIRAQGVVTKIDRNRHYCTIHGTPLDYRIGWCCDCGEKIEYRAIQGGNMPSRCSACATVRIKAQRKEASRRQVERRRAGIGPMRLTKKTVESMKPKRRWDCVYYEDCLYQSDDPGMCGGCERYAKREAVDYEIQPREWSEQTCYV